MKKTEHILLAKDNEDYALLFRRALKSARIDASLDVVHDGQEAVNYLVKNIWSNPKISGFTLRIAGSKSEHFEFLATNSIEVTGWVKDSNAFMVKSGTLVTPIQSGSGIRIKLLEAMALGIPCITTKLGAAGIDTTLSGVQIADTEQDFVDLILKFHESETLRQEVGKKSRDYISKVHSFDNCIALMKNTFGV